MTSVRNDAGSVLMNLAPPPSVKSTGAKSSFSDVLQKQSQVLPESGKTADAGKNVTIRQDKVNEQAESRLEDVSGTADAEKVQEPDLADGNEEDVTDEEAVVKAAEELAGQLLIQLAQELGKSVEAVKQALQDAGMTPMDLLEPGKLAEALLQAGGAQEKLSLLTDEKLFGSLQNLTQTLEEGLQQIAEMTGNATEEVENILHRLTQQTEPEQQELPGRLPIQMEKAGEEAAALQPVKQDAQTAAGEENVQSDGNADSAPGAGESAAAVKKQTEGGDGNTKDQTSGKESQQNPLLQNQGIQTPQTMQTAQLFGAEAMSGGTAAMADTDAIMKQIMDYMKIQIGTDTSSLEMQLHPESLGTLHIRISSKEGAVTAQFTTQNETVKAALESQMIQLKESFNEQGVKVEAIEVMVEEQAFERNLEQGQSGSQENKQSSHNARVRKINLEGMQSLSEDIPEEDRLTAEMMIHNGNTVDYMA